MKKLSLKNLKLTGNDLLQREQLKAVFGGYGGSGTQECKLTVVWSHSGESETLSGTHYSAGEAGSTEANQDCVDGITMGAVSRCSYDCEDDGWGQ